GHGSVAGADACRRVCRGNYRDRTGQRAGEGTGRVPRHELIGMRFFFALALVLSAITALPADQTTSSRLPKIDVVVEDGRGRTVETLGPSDFTVTEQSRPVAIDGVRFVRAAGKAAGVTAVPVSAPVSGADPDAGRVIAIYLDEFHVAS